MFKFTSINFSVIFFHVKLILISTIMAILIYILTFIRLCAINCCITSQKPLRETLTQNPYTYDALQKTNRKIRMSVKF